MSPQTADERLGEPVWRSGTDGWVVAWDRQQPAPEPDRPSGGNGRAIRQPRCLWCSGGIANRQALLASLPVRQRGPADAELLQDACAEHGPGALARRLAGTAAWLVWDPRRGELVAARDRLGTRGLYYAFAGGQVLIAERVDALLAVLRTRPRLNTRSAVAHIHRLAPLPGESFYEGIHAVPPGAMLIVSRHAGRVETYWRVERAPLLRLRSDAEYAEALRSLLFDVAAGYVDDRPAAVTVSSGLDSTSVAAAVRAAAPGQELVACYNRMPSLPAADESSYSMEVARHLQLPAFSIEADQHWPFSERQEAWTSAGAPLSICYAAVWAATFEAVRRRGAEVLFTGVSGDHLFGGSVTSYADLALTGRWLAAAREVAARGRRSTVGVPHILRMAVLAPVIQALCPPWRSNSLPPAPWLGARYEALYADDLAAKGGPYWTLPGVQQRLRLLQDRNLAPFAERLNFAARERGIELRHPLLDHRLFEFAARLPSAQTFAGGMHKCIVRRAMRGYLPEAVLELKEKIVLGSLLRRGLAERETARVWGLLTNMRAAELGLVDEAALREVYRGYLAGEHQSARLWHTLTLEEWLRRYH